VAIYIDRAEMPILGAAQESEACQRLDTIPEIRPLTPHSSARLDRAFRKGREFAAWVGPVPRQHSTEANRSFSVSAGKATVNLRKLFCSGERAVLKYSDKQCSDKTGLRRIARTSNTN
jgi:transposase